MLRVATCASIRCGASLPVPTISIVEASLRDRYRDAIADAAAVRRNVSSAPSSNASSSPVVPSMTT